MILVDTSVWVDHLRAAEPRLVTLLESGMVLAHPFVIGELSLGNLKQRKTILTALAGLPRSSVATSDEVLHFIERNRLHGRGIGYVDAHLLAAVRLHSTAALWTRDKRLHAVAATLDAAISELELPAN